MIIKKFERKKKKEKYVFVSYSKKGKSLAYFEVFDGTFQQE